MLDAEVPLVDDSAVSRRLRDGSTESVRWKDLVEVRVATTTTHKIAEDIRFVLRGGDGSKCVVSQRFAPDALLDHLQRLPGFDNGALIAAMVATGDADLLCWSASARRR